MRVLVVVGTRPEMIKMAPVIRVLKERGAQVVTLFTGQHREMLDQMARFFGVRPDADMNLMLEGLQSDELLGDMLGGGVNQPLGEWLREFKPDVVLAQGDTTTTLGAALACFYNRVPFGHVEAGLRSGNPMLPFPEEMHRRLITQVATWHFVPTLREYTALLREGVPVQQIVVTGNTVIDTLLSVVGQHGSHFEGTPSNRIILATVHRRESHGGPLQAIFGALKDIAEARPGVMIVLPVHPNPAVRVVAEELLGNVPNIQLVPPMGYLEFVLTMREATLILTDSGGVQEEAPSLGVPVLVLRDVTERPQAVECGAAKLIGTGRERIVEETLALLDDPEARAAMRVERNPFGDGRAAERIAGTLEGAYG